MWVDRRGIYVWRRSWGHSDQRCPKEHKELTAAMMSLSRGVGVAEGNGVDAARDLDEMHVYVNHTDANGEW